VDLQAAVVVDETELPKVGGPTRFALPLRWSPTWPDDPRSRDDYTEPRTQPKRFVDPRSRNDYTEPRTRPKRFVSGGQGGG
jgi:hypothetical protein